MQDRSDVFAQTAQISSIGHSACDIAADVRVATRNWFRDLADSAGAIQLRDATAAVEAMRDAWHADFGVYRAVLDQWCLAAKAAAAGYQTIDEYNAAQVNTVLPRRGLV